MTTRKLLDHWAAPDGAGRAVACFATTFTFDPAFFTDDCLSRFLSLTAIRGEGDKASSVAAVIEEEQRLAETSAISVLIDRRTAADKRNLRWDVLPVPVPKGLLHAKVSVLLWENHARVVVGSANLTPAGYRSQVEAAITVDITEGCEFARQPLHALADELASYLDLLPAEAGAAGFRARETLRLLRSRIDQFAADTPTSTVRIAFAPSRPGLSPLDVFSATWGSRKKPLTARVLSPFWDVDPGPVMNRVRSLLTGNPAAHRSLLAVVGENPAGLWSAPAALADHADDVRALKRTDSERRALHAKCLYVENDDWCCALVGSSNATASGFGLLSTKGHREANFWIGGSRTSALGKALRALAVPGKPIDLHNEEIATDDGDEWGRPALPDFFRWCTVRVEKNATTADFTFSMNDEEPSSWSIREPKGPALLTSTQWAEARASNVSLSIDRDSVPTVFDVTWADSDCNDVCGTWATTIDDPTHLPPPEELASLTADQLLRALASTRPFPDNIEHVTRVDARRKGAELDDLDPLRSFDASGLLMHRMRRHSESLQGLKRNLEIPTTSIGVVKNRLLGAFSPVSLAERISEDSSIGHDVSSESAFLIAEIALTIAAVGWPTVTAGCDNAEVTATLDDALSTLEALSRTSRGSDQAVAAYIDSAFAHARTSCGV